MESNKNKKETKTTNNNDKRKPQTSSRADDLVQMNSCKWSCADDPVRMISCRSPRADDFVHMISRKWSRANEQRQCKQTKHQHVPNPVFHNSNLLIQPRLTAHYKTKWDIHMSKSPAALAYHALSFALLTCPTKLFDIANPLQPYSPATTFQGLRSKTKGPMLQVPAPW